MAATIALAMSGPMPGNCHQLAATLALMCQHFDLFGNMVDPLIKMPPIAAEILDDPDHTWRQDVDALGQNLWQLLT
jgi:hypothetical protein